MTAFVMHLALVLFPLVALFIGLPVLLSAWGLKDAKYRAGFWSGVCTTVFLLLSGIPQDSFYAVRGTHAGDRWRLFLYYQTARVAGVPAALEQYGIKPPDTAK